jgi:tRNA-dihydrouridine synthase A
MRDPGLVARLCDSMGEASGGVPITVKCRIGVDDRDSYEELAEFVGRVAEGSGVRHFVVHARKALLNGISPQANRRVPPLKYDMVYRLLKVRPARLARDGLIPPSRPLRRCGARRLLTRAALPDSSQDFPDLRFTLNGGVLSLDDAETHLAQGLHGVMVSS